MCVMTPFKFKHDGGNVWIALTVLSACVAALFSWLGFDGMWLATAIMVVQAVNMKLIDPTIRAQDGQWSVTREIRCRGAKTETYTASDIEAVRVETVIDGESSSYLFDSIVQLKRGRTLRLSRRTSDENDAIEAAVSFSKHAGYAGGIARKEYGYFA